MSQASVMSGTDLSRRPHRVSRNMFEDHQVLNKVIVDAGCGSDISLARYLHERGAIYIGIDNDPRTWSTITHMAASAGLSDPHVYLVCEDIRKAEARYADYIHMRFVLAGMSFAEREAVIKQFATLAQVGLFVLEYDWNSFMRAPNNHELARSFFDILLEYTREAKIDLCYGSYAARDFQSWLPPYVEITEERDWLEAADIRPFLRHQLEVMLAFYKEKYNRSMLDKIFGLSEAIRKTAFECVPPDIVIVKVFTRPPTL